jgi:hypothetical protein
LLGTLFLYIKVTNPNEWIPTFCRTPYFLRNTQLKKRILPLHLESFLQCYFYADQLRDTPREPKVFESLPADHNFLGRNADDLPYWFAFGTHIVKDQKQDHLEDHRRRNGFITVNAVGVFDFIVNKVKVNIALNFSQDMIFANTLIEIDCGVKKLD